MGSLNQIAEDISINFRNIFESIPGLFLILLPDAPKFTIVAMSDAYCDQTMTKREEILGKGYFEVFGNFNDRNAETSIMKASLNRVIQFQLADSMTILQKDIWIPESEGGGFELRYWSPMNYPIFDSKNKLTYIVLHIEDVTSIVQSSLFGSKIRKKLPPFIITFLNYLERLKIRKILRYVGPLLLVFMVLFVQIYLHELIVGKIFMLLSPAIFIGAVIAGFGPGIIATIITSLSIWFYILPLYHSSKINTATDEFSLFVFAFTGIMFSIFGGIKNANFRVI